MDRRILVGLTAGALGLPMAVVVFAAAAGLLSAVGDSGGAVGLARTAVVLGVVWACDLVALVVVLAVERTLTNRPRDDDY